MTDHARAKELVAARFRIGDELHDAPPKRWTDGECNQVAAYVRALEAERDRLEAMRKELIDAERAGDALNILAAYRGVRRAALNGGGDE